MLSDLEDAINKAQKKSKPRKGDMFQTPQMDTEDILRMPAVPQPRNPPWQQGDPLEEITKKRRPRLQDTY